MRTQRNATFMRSLRSGLSRRITSTKIVDNNSSSNNSTNIRKAYKVSKNNGEKSTMPSDDDGDGDCDCDDDHSFVDEDETEIVSLLDRRDRDHETTAIASGPAAGRSNINKCAKKAKSKSKLKTTPWVHIVGVFAMLVLVLLIATISLSRSSSLLENKTPSIIANHSEIINESGGNEDDINWFELHTGNARIDRAYRLAIDELHQNIKHDANGSPYFVAGAGWDQLWTRDTAFAVEQAAGLIQPDISRKSLENCTEVASVWNGEHHFSSTFWLQDVCGHFGSWPNLTDAIVGARGAWHLYLYTGNSTFLEWAYETTVSSLLRAEYDALINEEHAYFKGGLFGGCSSFMESNSGYPSKYQTNGALVGKTKALSTNILYYNGYYYAYKMAEILIESNIIRNSLKDRSKALKKTIRDRLWMEDKESYAYFEDEDGHLVEQTEGLGIALLLLSEDFESEHRIKMLFKNVHRTELGIPSLWPRFDLGEIGEVDMNEDFTDIAQWYHNGRIWPFVSGYFAIAAARHGRPDIFAEEMAHLIDLSEQKNTFAEYYELDKTFPEERSRQLWSDTGYLGIVYKGLFGMDFQTGGIEFSPSKVEGKNGVLKTDETISLLNVKYRKAILDIHVTGFGTNVTSFKLNGEVQELPKMDAYVNGRQLIEIEVAFPFK